MQKVYLSKEDRKIFGVCGGISKALDVDANLVRLTVVFLCLATAIVPVLITYLLAWIIFPSYPKDE